MFFANLIVIDMMKMIKIITSVALVCLSALAMSPAYSADVKAAGTTQLNHGIGQRPHGPIEDVLVALRTGNASQLAKHFDTRIDVTLPDKTDNFSRNQAEMIIKDFFAANEVRNFTVKHQGENEGSKFYIGTLQTRNGNFRTKIYMKKKGGQEVVKEITFQREE